MSEVTSTDPFRGRPAGRGGPAVARRVRWSTSLAEGLAAILARVGGSVSIRRVRPA